MLKIGVMDSVIGGVDDLQAFDRARRVGAAGVEARLTRAELRSGERLGRLEKARRAFSLDVPSLCLDDHNRGGIGSPDPREAEEAAEDLRIAVRWAAALGARTILVPFFSVAELTSSESRDRAVGAFQKLCPLAAEQGVTLAYEGTLAAGPIRELAGRIGSPAFGCYFDPANLVVRALDPPTEIRALGDIVCQVHIKDLRARKNDSRPGLGRVDFAECASALGEIGYDGWLVLETPVAPPPVVQRDIAFTRSVFGLVDGAHRPTFGAFSYELDDWRDLVETFDELGLGAVQVGEPLLGRCLDDLAEADTARTILEEHKLEVAALAGYRNLVTANDRARGANIAFLARCLETAPALGTWVVATEAGTRSHEGRLDRRSREPEPRGMVPVRRRARRAHSCRRGDRHGTRSRGSPEHGAEDPEPGDRTYSSAIPRPTSSSSAIRTTTSRWICCLRSGG